MNFTKSENKVWISSVKRSARREHGIVNLYGLEKEERR
jgi:hypothetical protein